MPSPELDLKFTVQVPSQADEQALASRVLRALAARYRAFAEQHFDQSSKGNGTWKPLKPSTIKAKLRKRKAAKINKKNPEQAALAPYFDGTRILVFTGQLKGALNPSMRTGGMKETYTGNGLNAEVKIAFTGKLHSAAGGSNDKMTIAKLAAIHHFGSSARHIPARPILVEPTSEVKRQMEAIIQSEIQGELGL